jgi:aminopeptidase N
LQNSIFATKLVQLGFEYDEAGSELDARKRTLCISNAAAGKDETTILELMNRFQSFKNGNVNAFHSNIRGNVFATALAYSKNPQQDFAFLLRVGKQSTNIDEKTTALTVLGAVNDLTLTKQVLYDIAFDSSIVKPQDIPRCIISMARFNPFPEEVLQLLWTWFQEKFDVLHEKLSGTITLFSRVVEYAISNNVGNNFITLLEDWSAGKGCSEKEKQSRLAKIKFAQRALDQSMENIRGNTNWVERDHVSVSNWLSKHISDINILPSNCLLPANVKPLHYDIFFRPGLETFNFYGKVEVTLEVQEDSYVITANALDLVITKAWVKQNHHQESKRINYHLEKQTVDFEFDSLLIKGTTVALVLEFTGVHNDTMAGFYRSGYLDQNGKQKYMVLTQCCATDCRRCFPCWDEPELKAVFEVTLEIPNDRIGLANMNLVQEKVIEKNDGSQAKLIQFAPTPLMSTYLLCIVVGEFDYLEAFANPNNSSSNEELVRCRVYTLPGQKDLGKYALGISTRTLEYFSQYFDMAYPLPKLDMVAIPDFGVGAMYCTVNVGKTGG